MSEAAQYIGALLQKQAMQQRAKEQEIANSLYQQNQLSKSLSGIGDDLQRRRETDKQDAIANSLMNEEVVPRAHAVDGNLEAKMQALGFKPATIGDVAPRSGGINELKMRMALDDQKNRQDNAALTRAMEDKRFALMEASLAETTRNHNLINADRLESAKAAEIEKSRNATKDAWAYNSKQQAAQDDLQKAVIARDKFAYDSAVNFLESNYVGAITAGLKGIKPPVIPPLPALFTDTNDFLKSQEREKTLQSQVNENDLYPGPDFLGWGENRKTALAREQEKLKSSPGNPENYYRREIQEAPPEIAEPAQSTASSPYKEGELAVNPKTGERLIYRNGQWQTQ